MTNVLGLGNVLMGDDGFGPAVVRAFENAYAVGPDVLVVDVGTPGLDLTPWLADVDRVIIVDTVKSELPPGALEAAVSLAVEAIAALLERFGERPIRRACPLRATSWPARAAAA